jgi:hypothetical protein
MRQKIKALNDLEKMRSHLEHLVIDRRVIKTDLEEIGRNSVDWIHLAQDRNQWRVLVNMVLTLRV